MNQSSMKYVSNRDEADQVVPGHRYLLRWIKPYLKKTKVLDIGCWTGPLETLLEHEDCKVSAIDIEEEPLKYARKRFPKMTFKQASLAEKLPFKKDEFDNVLYFMVIEHIPIGTEELAFKNINRVMKKKGNLFMSTMHSSILSNLLDPAYFITKHRHYSEKHLTELLKKAGFEVKEVYLNGGWFTTLHIWMLYFFKHILRMKEPRGPFMDRLMDYDYQNKGFAEIEIRAIKKKDV